MNRKIIIICTLFTLSLGITAKDYKASLFGIKSDGATLNTESIQYAIDHISENGGGRLVFYVGRYLTGSFKMKPNVTIQLHEGAVLVAFRSIYDYFEVNNTKALILADSIENIGITGKGVIEGHGNGLLKSIAHQVQKGYLDESALRAKPALIHFNECSNITLDGIIMREACGDTQVYHKCNNLNINNITVESKATPSSRGVVISNCDGVTLSSSYFDTSGDELSANETSTNVSVRETINSKGKNLQLTDYGTLQHLGEVHRTTAIYHDDAACGMKVHGNILYKAGTIPTLIGGGSDNTYTNNIFIDCPIGIKVDNRLQAFEWAKHMIAPGGIIEQRLTEIKHDQPPYSIRYPELAEYWNDDPSFPKRNLIDKNLFVHVEKIILKVDDGVNADKEFLDFTDNNLITDKDPGFTDYTNKDFRLKNDSKVFGKIPGFEPVPFEKMGTMKNKE